MRIKGKERLSSWDGDWEGRIYERIGELGFQKYSDYLLARRGRSYRELAAELSRDDNVAPVAPVQLERLHALTVTAADRRDAILDSFVRFLRGALRKGWGVGIHWQTNVIGDLSSWHVNWGQGDELDEFEREVIGMHPELGWTPKDSDDPIIQEAARRVWSKG
jgi:hypothetical protein